MNTQTDAAKIKNATISDYTGYDPDRCNNGGSYGFWENYNYIGGGEYEHTYHTTADFEYCPYCGSFNSGDCCSEPEIIDEKELWKRIKAAQNDPLPEISAEFELFDVAKWIAKIRRRVRDALNKTTNENAIINCAFNLDVSMK
jgi:hypothetical protein